MAVDLVNEQASMLARAGSFWYRVLGETDRRDAHTLNRVGIRTRVHAQLNAAHDAVLSGGYFKDFYRSVHFTDKDIVYFGLDEALQARHRGYVSDTTALRRLYEEKGVEYPYTKEPVEGLARGTKLEVDAVEATADVHGMTPVIADHDVPLIIPTDQGTLILPENYRATFGLIVDPDLLVLSIRLEDGSVLFNGVDFKATYGFIAFSESPVAKFPHMHFVAESIIYRQRNLLCYTLQVNHVYGPVDRIMHYYRASQSIKSLYLAAAQACGMAVIREDDVVRDIIPLHDGCSYIMESGARYDADYEHVRLQQGYSVAKDTVIGSELFQLIGPNGSIGDITDLWTGHAMKQANVHLQGSAIAELLLGPLRNRFIVVRVNGSILPRDMQLDLHAFLSREAPIGSILVYAPLGPVLTVDNL